MKLKSINPKNNKLIGSWDSHSSDDIANLLSQANKAYLNWMNTDLSFRINCLEEISNLLREGAKEFGALMADEMGKPIAQGLAEIEKCAWLCDYYKENAESFLSPKSIDTEKFREKTLDSLDLLYNSTASDYFDGFFNVMIVEPISADGSSSIDMVADGNCVDWSDNIFCYSESKLTAIESLLFPEIYADVTAIISALPGRGVTSYYSNRPTTMVQPIAERTARTFGHELGHAHANLGDEYSSDGEREYTSEEIENYSYWDINVAVDDDPNTIKWSHFINDKTSVPGIDPLADIDQTGIFEGSYYSESDSYRPKQYSIMGCSRCEDLDPGCWTVQFERNNCADFIEVHTEGFGIQSVLNLFRNPFDNDGTEFTGDSEIEGIKIKAGIVSGGKIDTSKLKLEWYKDGILVNGQNNNLQVDFQRPNTDTWTTYSWKLVDLTGAIIVPDNIDDPNDCYLGLFDWYSGAFQTENQSTVYWNPPFNLNDSRYQDYLYGYTMGCMSGTLMINWNKY